MWNSGLSGSGVEHKEIDRKRSDVTGHRPTFRMNTRMKVKAVVMKAAARLKELELIPKTCLFVELT